MTRLFTEKVVPADQKNFTFSGEDAKYLADVLRMKPGECVCLCDGANIDITAKIKEVSSSLVTADLTHREINRTEPPYKAIMYQALVKGDKMDFVIQKGVELGVSKIVPVSCVRSIAKVAENDMDKKVIRWQKIAHEAARQCGRGAVPKVEAPISFLQAVAEAQSNSDLIFIPWECEKSLPLSSLLDDFSSKRLKINLEMPCISFFIGPEGGFDPFEIDLAHNAGVKSVTLGRRILRTETAGLAVLSMFIYRLEQM